MVKQCQVYLSGLTICVVPPRNDIISICEPPFSGTSQGLIMISLHCKRYYSKSHVISIFFYFALLLLLLRCNFTCADVIFIHFVSSLLSQAWRSGMVVKILIFLSGVQELYHYMYVLHMTAYGM